MEYISDKFIKKMIMNPELGIVNLIRVIHFNPDVPQNRNLFVKSRKFNFVEIYKRTGWKTMSRKDVFQNLIASKKDTMDEYFDRFCDNKELSQKYIEKYDYFSDNLDKYINHIVFATEYDPKLKKAKSIYDKICKMINLLFLNNQKIEITYTPEQNIKTSPNELKTYIKNRTKGKPKDDDSYGSICTEDLEMDKLTDCSDIDEEQKIVEIHDDEEAIDPKENFVDMLDDNEREVLRMIREKRGDKKKILIQPTEEDINYLSESTESFDLEDDSDSYSDSDSMIITKID